MKQYVFFKRITICLMAFLLIACSKEDVEKTTDRDIPEVQTMQEAVQAKDLRTCSGCIPRVTVALETGYVVVRFTGIISTSPCRQYKVSITVNGSTDTGEVDLNYQLGYPSSVRIREGLSCSGSVEITCLENECQVDNINAFGCSRTYYFSFAGNGEGGIIDKPTCGKNLTIVKVRAPQTGKFLVDVPFAPIDGYMLPDKYIVYYSNGYEDLSQCQGNLLSGSINEITFPATGSGVYWIKMYNSAICGNHSAHYLKYNMIISTGYSLATLITNH